MLEMQWLTSCTIVRVVLASTLHLHVTTFSLPGCNSYGNFDIVQSQQPSLTCTGLTARNNIYWSITDPSSNEETRIAECTQCNPKCPPCSDPIAGYNVSRESNETTTLQFLNSSLVTEESTIKCSPFLNYTNVACQLFVLQAYTISDCREHAVTITDGIQTPIRCEGLLPAQNMYWTITYDNGTVSSIAQCNYCARNSHTCPNCTVTDSARNDFSVTREDNSSTLVIQTNVRQTDGATLRCSRKDNTTHDDCTIHVESFPVNQEQDSRFPVAAVAGSVAGCVFIVTVVIVIAVIVKRERSKAEVTSTEAQATSTANGAADTYDGLHMQDVGLPSVYSEIGQRPVGSASDADYIDLYHGLDMSEVGQRAEYSQLGRST